MFLGSARLEATVCGIQSAGNPASLVVLGVKRGLCEMWANGEVTMLRTSERVGKSRRLEAEVKDSVQKPWEGLWFLQGVE